MKSKKEILERGVIALVILAIFIILFSVKTIDNRKPLNMIYISKSIDENNEFWMRYFQEQRWQQKNITLI